MLRGNVWAQLGWLLGLGCLVSGCGLTSHNGGGEGGDAAPAVEPQVEDLRLSKIATGVERYCGLTLEGDVVCVKGKQLDLRWAGPFQDMAFHQDMVSFSELCATTDEGELKCETAPELVPSGRFTKVAIGFFNPCALAEDGHVACWFDDAIGGSPAPDVAGAIELSVDFERGCVLHDLVGHAECFGKDTPNGTMDDHFIRVAVAPNRICGTVIGLEPPGLVCLEANGERTRLAEGFFTSVDVNVNGDGCALGDGGGMLCWGALEGLALPGSFSQVSVASGRVCALEADGAVTCSSD